MTTTQRYAVGKAGRFGGQPRVYEVEPVGDVHPDPEFTASGFGSDQRIAPLARVVREIPLPGLSHWDHEHGELRRGRGPRLAEPPDPEGLLRGDRLPGKKKGRKGLRRPRAGWKAYVKDAQEQPVIRQNELMDRYNLARAWRTSPWIPVTDSAGSQLGMEKERVQLLERFEGDVLGNEVWLKGPGRAGIWRPRGWVKWEPQMALHEIVDKVVPEGEQPYHEGLEGFWSEVGRPGRYRTMSGGPGTEFHAQHERIMEVGARLDAELRYRTRESEKPWLEADKRYERAEREYKRLLKAHEVASRARGLELYNLFASGRTFASTSLTQAEFNKRDRDYWKELRKPAASRDLTKMVAGQEVRKYFQMALNETQIEEMHLRVVEKAGEVSEALEDRNRLGRDHMVSRSVAALGCCARCARWAAAST